MSNRKKQTSLPKLLENIDPPYTYEKIIDFLANTGWVEGHIRKTISPLDRNYLDDYIGIIWEEILRVPQEKIVDLYTRGKGLLVNYIKTIIRINLRSLQSKCFQIMKEPQKIQVSLDDEQWSRLEDTGESTYDEQFPLVTGSGRYKQFSFESDPIEIKVEDEDDILQEA